MKTVRWLSICAVALVVVAAIAFGQDPFGDPKPSEKKPAAPPRAGKAKEPSAKAAKKSAGQTTPKSVAHPRRSVSTKLSSSESGRSWVDVSTYPKDKPMLIVHYPWKALTKASIEARMLREDNPSTEESEEDDDDNALRPLAFVARMMRGDVTLAVYRCLDLTEEAKRVKSFTTPVLRHPDRSAAEFQVIAQKNHLGRAAGTVVFPPMKGGKDPKGNALPSPEPMARAIYFPLAPWATDQETLRIELPSEHFAKPGRLRIWFLRDGDTIWWQTVAWPGLPNGATAEKDATKSSGATGTEP